MATLRADIPTNKQTNIHRKKQKIGNSCVAVFAYKTVGSLTEEFQQAAAQKPQMEFLSNMDTVERPLLRFILWFL